MQDAQGEMRREAAVRILRCAAESAYVSLFAAEETQTVAAAEAKVAAIVGPGFAGSGQGRLTGAVTVTDRDAGIDGLEARVFGECFVSGNAK
jgi:hypothetical protein